MDLAGLAPLLDALAASAPAAWLRRSGTAYLVVNASHIAALGLGVGAALLLDLRLWGIIGRRIPLALLGPFLSRAAAAGLALALATGLWLFATRPGDYLANPAFLVKVGLIAFALVNALSLHAGGHWDRALREGHAGGLVRAQAAVSLTLWLGAVLAGRWIGFL
ncbi:DUF2214 domain-containing protein [Paracidovorax valerianellae]|uniref:DUF2214 domain-containing protein n=1 Tax=Paracidovorax valerianellae TaxID=187868 RepID=A0A1G6RAL3_9BURK|nr:DUF2214 domain-containing protein [Paracidovorax valerianellae]MDA8445058.1 DUF2214 domain-containing protein [Paracidovorax valerianellae]SDD01649.1 hypothetical protein SAMN05192589_10493 [Paracidovorax valerianellae]